MFIARYASGLSSGEKLVSARWDPSSPHLIVDPRSKPQKTPEQPAPLVGYLLDATHVHGHLPRGVTPRLSLLAVVAKKKHRLHCSDPFWKYVLNIASFIRLDCLIHLIQSLVPA